MPPFFILLVSTSWSMEDKKMLLSLLQKRGADNLEIIRQGMPHKTMAEIRYICEKHTKLAAKKMQDKEKQFDTISSWIDILKKVNGSVRGPVHDIIPRVLKYIALYEKRTSVAQINLSDCYLVLASISNGTAPKKLNETSNYFLFQCIVKLAVAVQNGEINSYKSHLKSLKKFFELCRSPEDGEENYDRVLNPLRVPKSSLRMTETERNIDIFEEVPEKVKVDLTEGFL